ncbi:MAG: cytochrome c1 [bacterium]
MKLLKFALLALLLNSVQALANEGGNLEAANINISDKESLQRGAKLFVNYCLSCHSAKYMRYKRLAADLDLTEEEGWNNALFPNVGMPHVLAGLQGAQTAKAEVHVDEDGIKHHKMVVEAPKVAGSMSAKEYDESVRDLVNYLVYMGEPAALQRMEYGPYVIIFLVFFSFIAYLMKKEYWKDIH